MRPYALLILPKKSTRNRGLATSSGFGGQRVLEGHNIHLCMLLHMCFGNILSCIYITYGAAPLVPAPLTSPPLDHIKFWSFPPILKLLHVFISIFH